MDIETKVAVLEERLTNYMDETTKLLGAIKTSQDEARAEMIKYKGFMGGVTFIISAIFTIIMLLKEKIFG